MVLKKLVRKGLALLMIVAMIGYYSFAGKIVKAKEVGLGEVLEETKKDSIQVNEKRSDKKQNAYIIKTKDKKTLRSVKEKYIESDEINSNEGNKLEENKFISVELLKKQAKQLEKNENIEFIEEDYILEGCKNNKERVKKEKHIKKETRLKKNDSKDWGNDINLVYQVSLVPGEEDMTQIFMDGSGHGSSVASLIAANDDGKGISGINPNVDIYSYRVLEEGNVAPVSRVVEAIYMAIEQKVNIINMSFGLSEYSETLERAIHAAKNAGILIIASAGNTGEEGVQYPAAYRDVVAVGAVDKYGIVEDYSAKGKEVEIVAPGELVKTTGFIGSEEVLSGTSLAAPQVTAVASLIWQKDLSVSADFVRGLLIESANLYGKTSSYGNGLVDAEYALSHYEEYKRNYEKRDEGKEKLLISENQSKITTFQDTGCVKGCWSQTEHENMIAADYYNVRYGARFPDTSRYGSYDDRVFARMTLNPWWHGYLATNYIQAVLFASRMGDAIYKYGVGNAHKADKNNYQDANEMLSDINKINWSTELAKIGKGGNNTKGFQRAFIWGMAIHSATDIFSHSSFNSQGRILHEYNQSVLVYDADNRNYYPERFSDACEVAKRIMSKYNAKKKLLATDLLPYNAPSTYKLPFHYRYFQMLGCGYVVETSSYGYIFSTK